ncbi:peptidase S8/S53 domain-containing protein [Syncephalastrum racemosum]|uniref:Peptidase S8/S53 domain-containing protein n=1 Tax=Syncephalastrum racemosum TaxID=13706 RepID=A0A1X2HEA4_SYNRA|nr:peptidase S8/S53 domain-containing protein [Syncephalastrum racemosum]
MRTSTLCSQTFRISVNHPKFVPSPHGNPLAGRYIVEFSESYRGSPNQFLNDLDRNYDWSVANELTSDIFRGVSLHLQHNASRVHAATSDSKSGLLQAMHQMMDKEHVKRVFPVVEVPRPKTLFNSVSFLSDVLHLPDDASMRLPFAHQMTQVDRVQNELGLKGKGITVGIIDTGVDYRHPSLGGGFGPGYKVQYGYDLVGDNFNYTEPDTKNPKTTPLDDCPRSAAGHGTHVAGIIGAEDETYNFTGVAPGATLGMWRIFGCNGSTTNDLVVKALIMAYEAGCDVINMSLGGANSWNEDPAAVIADRIAERNVTVVVAAGNEGDKGAYMISSPSTGTRVISVASVDNDYSLKRTMRLDGADANDTDSSFPYDLSSTTEQFPNGTLVAYSGPEAPSNDACQGTQPTGDITGKIVLVKRGSCFFDEKASVVAAAGGKALLVYDSAGLDAFQPTTTDVSIPVAAISFDAGQRLLSRLATQEEIQADFSMVLSPIKVSTAGRVSAFTSVGPTNELEMKPDVAGIGGFVFSTLPLSQGGYGTLSGTSMASPYVAGVVALMLEARRDQTPVDILKSLQNHAKLATAPGNILDNPIRQGAGLIQAYDAIHGRVRITPGKVSFNDTVHRAPAVITLHNDDTSPVTYQLRNIPALAVQPYDTKSQGYAPLEPAAFSKTNVSAELRFDAEQITLQPGERRTVSVVVDRLLNYVDPDDHPFPVYGGYIALVAEDETKSLHVPYIGVEGDITKLPMFDQGFPVAVNQEALDTQNASLAQSYTLDRNDPTGQNAAIYIVYRLLTGTAEMRTDVLNESHEKIGTLLSTRYLQRNNMDTENWMTVDTWNGTYVPNGQHGSQSMVPVPSGTYTLRWSALKLWSDPEDPASWETFESVPITVV